MPCAERPVLLLRVLVVEEGEVVGGGGRAPAELRDRTDRLLHPTDAAEAEEHVHEGCVHCHPVGKVEGLQGGG